MDFVNIIITLKLHHHSFKIRSSSSWQGPTSDIMDENSKRIVDQLRADNAHLQRCVAEGRDKLKEQDREYRELNIVNDELKYKINQVNQQNRCLQQELNESAETIKRLRRELNLTEKDTQYLHCQFEDTKANCVVELRHCQEMFLKQKCEMKALHFRIDAQRAEIATLRRDNTKLLDQEKYSMCSKKKMEYLAEELQELRLESRRVIDEKNCQIRNLMELKLRDSCRDQVSDRKLNEDRIALEDELLELRVQSQRVIDGKDDEIQNLTEQLYEVKGDLCRLHEEYRCAMSDKRKEIKAARPKERIQEFADETDWEHERITQNVERRLRRQKTKNVEDLAKLLELEKCEIRRLYREMLLKNHNIQKMKVKLHGSDEFIPAESILKKFENENMEMQSKLAFRRRSHSGIGLRQGHHSCGSVSPEGEELKRFKDQNVRKVTLHFTK